jgi:alcohol dehydrogenase
MEGRPGLCEPAARANSVGTLLSGAKRLSRPKEPLFHHLGVSAFAEYAVVSRRSAVKVDKSLPAQEAALFGCAVMTGVGAVVNTAKVPAGCNVAVVGLGGVGLCALLAANAVGAAKIIAIDTNPSKLTVAAALGATHTVLAGADSAAEVRDLTGGGADFSFEMASSVPALKLAYDIPRYISLYQQGKLPINKLLSETVGLEELNEAFDRLAEGKSIRQVMVL